MARIILNRLNNKITPNIFPETVRILKQPKYHRHDLQPAADPRECIEQNMQLYAVFIDSTEALDTVSREGLWIILKKFGCTDKVLNMIKALHEGMQAQVVQGKDISKKYAVTNGVKQGCVLAPTLFSLYLTAMLKVPFRNLHEGIYIQTRHGADLSDESHFKAKTRTTRFERCCLLMILPWWLTMLQIYNYLLMNLPGLPPNSAWR